MRGGWPFSLGNVLLPRRTWIQRGKPMVGYLNLRRWLLLPLINIAITLTLCMSQADATLLKDVRIGEYDKFTRIVFEFDGPISTQRITALEAGRLKISFADTSPDLIRKIPIDRIDRVREVHIWVRKTEMSAVLTFTFDHFRFESFALSNPPRVALDVYRLANTAPGAKLTAPGGNEDASAKPHQGHTPKQVSGTAPETVPNPPVPEKKSVQHPRLPDRAAAETGQFHLPTGRSNTPIDGASALQPPPNQRPAHSETPAGMEAAQQTLSESSSLQYYLVVALVVITIIILVLLLLMLISRKHWVENNKPIKVDEFLQRQDERIASLDARIQEQLKRYDDA